jgi:hypothetical protein
VAHLQRALAEVGIELTPEMNFATSMRKPHAGPQILRLRSRHLRSVVSEFEPAFAALLSCHVIVRETSAQTTRVAYNEPMSLALGTRHPTVVAALERASQELHATLDQLQQDLDARVS